MASTPIIGAIFLFAGNFAPRNYMLCQGQLLSIASYAALFSILGTTYGGNGTTTFGLPDLRGRMAVGQGAGPGIPAIVLGELAGSASATLTTSNLPAHTHQVNCNGSATGTGGSTFAEGAGQTPVGHYPGLAASPANAVYAASANGTMNAAMLSSVGNGTPISTVPPYLGLNYIIAIVGVFPSRN